jgi:PAS domain S-box-containing protein
MAAHKSHTSHPSHPPKPPHRLKPPKKAVPSRQATRSQLETQLRGARRELAGRQDNAAAMESMRVSRAAIESSREHYLDLFEFGPVGYLTVDRSGVIRDLNLTAADLLARKRANLVGIPFLMLVAQPGRRPFLSHLNRLHRGEPQSSVELELKRLDGSRVPVHVISVPRIGGSVRAVEYRCVMLDLSERKLAEAHTAALARLGLTLSAATNPATAALAVVDAALEYCGWDACFLLMCDPATGGVTNLVHMDTIKGRRVPVPPLEEGRPPSPMVDKVMREGPQLILRRSEAEAGPLTARFGDVSRVSLSLMFVPVRLAGKSMGVLSVQSYRPNAYTGEDLVALQGLANHAAVALARLQSEADLLRANAELEARVAARTAELQQYRDHLQELVKQRTTELEAANVQLRQEITQREAAEEALLRRSEELKRSNLDLEQFAYVASHDLQEPLRAVGGFVRLLEHRFNDKLDPKGREYITGAAEGANRMGQLIQDLLALSRVSTAAQEFTLANLGVPLDTALHNLQFAIKAANASVTRDKLPKVRVDERQMFQLFQNLIGNALKFRNEAPPQIHIGARAEKGRWVISVRDNGIGIDPQYSERIFQVFQRLHTRTKYPGTGVGLAICKRIVERHGGRIWVESHPGQGTTFFFTLAADVG